MLSFLHFYLMDLNIACEYLNHYWIGIGVF